MKKKRQREDLLYRRRQIAKGLHTHPSKIYFSLQSQSLLQELSDYSINQKAERIYYRCLFARKTKWAENIKKKYNIKIHVDDRVSSMYLAMLHILNK